MRIRIGKPWTVSSRFLRSHVPTKSFSPQPSLPGFLLPLKNKNLWPVPLSLSPASHPNILCHDARITPRLKQAHWGQMKTHTNFPQGRCSLTSLCVPMRFFFLSLCWICYNIASALSLGFLAARQVGSYLAPGSGIEPSHLALEGSCAQYSTSALCTPCIGRRSFHHRTTMEVSPHQIFFFLNWIQTHHLLIWGQNSVPFISPADLASPCLPCLSISPALGLMHNWCSCSC